MDLIYMNAVCTIIAAAGSDPSYGLPGACWRLREPRPTTAIAGHMLLSVGPNPLDLIQTSKWMTRAWVY